MLIRIIGLVMAIGLGAFFCYQFDSMSRRRIFVSFSYCVEATASALPKDDSELEAWLQKRPGVSPNTVAIRRFKGKDKDTVLEVGFLQSRNLAGDPAFPDIASECKRLGYKGEIIFRDCTDRHRE